MPEYSLNFAERLAESAASVVEDGLEDPDAGRAALYLSLLATEITLKAMLEQAGVPISTIRSCNHRLHDLLSAVDRCSIAINGSVLNSVRGPASRVRARELHFEGSVITVGVVLEAEQSGASSYPTQVRYGNVVRHYPPTAAVAMAAG